MIGHDVFFSARQGCEIRIGNGCTLNSGCHVVAICGIEIGDHTLIGEYCSIRDQNHDFSEANIPISHQGFDGVPIFIGRDVWIGRGVFIGPGVRIGEGAVIGANSVVTRDIPAFSVAVGAPARVIRTRYKNR
jgi:acetyltransferase-like isoleucine patch superfamily enzyme